jgi:hypothetical protein
MVSRKSEEGVEKGSSGVDKGGRRKEENEATKGE